MNNKEAKKLVAATGLLFLQACGGNSPSPSPSETRVIDIPPATATTFVRATDNPPTRTPELPATKIPSVFESVGGPVGPEMLRMEEDLLEYIKLDLVPKGILNARVVALETQDPKYKFLYIQYTDKNNQVQSQMAPSWDPDGKPGSYTPQKPGVYGGQKSVSLPINFGNPNDFKVDFMGMKKVPGQNDLVPSYDLRRGGKEKLVGNFWIITASTPTPEPTATKVEFNWNQSINVTKASVEYRIGTRDFGFMYKGTAIKVDLSRASVGAKIRLGVGPKLEQDFFTIDKKADGLYLNGNLIEGSVLRLDAVAGDGYIYANSKKTSTTLKIFERIIANNASGVVIEVANPLDKPFLEFIPPTPAPKPTEKPSQKCILGIVYNPNSSQVPYVGGGFILSGVPVVEIFRDDKYAYVKTYNSDTGKISDMTVQVDVKHFQPRNIIGPTPDCAK